MDNFFLAKIFIGGGHIFSTYFPLALKIDFNHLPWSRILVYPLAFVAFYSITNLISSIAFKILLAISALLHIYLQHFGWFKIINNGSFKTLSKNEKYFFYALLGLPNILWLLNQLKNPPSYLYAISMFYSVPNFVKPSFDFLALLSVLLLIGSIYFSISRRKSIFIINFAKIIFYTSTAFWMCLGLFFFDSLVFFHVYLALSHGASYMIYISEGWPNHPENGKWNVSFKYIKVSTIALTFGFLWVLMFRFLKSTPDYLLFLSWMPLILHYSYDSMIWRKSLNPNLHQIS